MLAATLSQEVLAGSLYTILGGVGLVVFSALVSVGRQAYNRRRLVKAAPIQQDTRDIAILKGDVAELKIGFSEINGWLRGGKDLLGRDKHDGFIETFPAYQSEVREAFIEVGGKLDKILTNGHGGTT